MTGQHYTRVSKIENGVQAPTDGDIRDWCGACSAEEQAADLIATSRAVESAYLEFRRQARAGMKCVLGAHTLKRYKQTSVFRIYEHNVIPGSAPPRHKPGNWAACWMSCPSPTFRWV